MRTRRQEGIGRNVRRRASPRPGDRLTRTEIEALRQDLQTSRGALVNEIARLEAQSLHHQMGADAATGSVRGSPLDPGDAAWGELLALRATDNKRALLRAIDAALDRIDQNAYGVCAGHRKLIPKDRLRDIPWATLCEECMTECVLAPS